jgi:hypothetical protein
VAGCLLAVTVGSARAAVPSPTVEDATPVGDPFVAGTTFDLAAVGYVREEYFFSGTTAAYEAPAPLDPNGLWTVTPGESAPYKTRLLVYRPASEKHFKGTVVAEWLNVSGGLDSAPDWITAHVEMIRSGMIWVGVSVQFVGVEGGGSGFVNFPLKGVNRARYGTLSHPGDSFSYDIFSQAGQAIRDLSGTARLGGFVVKRLLAVGESQSAFRMTTYVNAVHPIAGVYDGFLVHSRGDDGAPLSQSPQPVVPAPTPTLIRTDLDVPVLTFQTETDVIGLGSLASRQPDTKGLRLWEVAGTAHADVYTLFTGWSDIGDSPDFVAIVVTASPIPGIIECARPINAGPQHFVLNAALAALDRWVRRGKPPRSAPWLDVSPGDPPSFVLDEHGNVRGGIRTPWLDVPVATLSGLGQTGSAFCGLFGTTMPFDPATLAALYPTSRAFTKAFTKATKRAARRGHLRRKDAKLIRQWARTADVAHLFGSPSGAFVR